MKLTIVTIGKFKSAEYKSLFDNYLKLTSKFCDVRHETLNSQDKATAFLEKKTGNVVIALLDERGKEFKSREFAREIEKMQNAGRSELVIMCGSEHGYDESVKKRASFLLSLSQFTMPHEMAAAVLSEQLFRAHSIIANHPYHND